MQLHIYMHTSYQPWHTLLYQTTIYNLETVIIIIARKVDYLCNLWHEVHERHGQIARDKGIKFILSLTMVGKMSAIDLWTFAYCDKGFSKT